MNKLQKARLSSFTLPLAHLNENKTLFENLPGFVMVLDSATAVVNAIQDTHRRRQQLLTGVKDNKDVQHENMVLSILSLSGMLVTFASIEGLTELKDKMHFTHSQLSYISSKELYDVAKNVLEGLKKNMAGVKNFGISDAVVSNFETIVSQFGVTAESTRDAITDKQGDTKLLNELFKEANRIFEEQLDQLMQQFRVSHRSFYDLYVIKRAMISPASRSTGASGVITDSVTGAPLKDVTANLIGSTLKVVSDEEGEYTLEAPIYGVVMVQFNKAGYKPYEAEIRLKKGKTTELNPVLVAV